MHHKAISTVVHEIMILDAFAICSDGECAPSHRRVHTIVFIAKMSALRTLSFADSGIGFEDILTIQWTWTLVFLFAKKA